MYICNYKEGEKPTRLKLETMTTQPNSQIRIKGLQLVDLTIILQSNVNNGCEEDEDQLEINLARLEAFKIWADANDEIIPVRHYFASRTFGYSHQFIATEMLNNIFN